MFTAFIRHHFQDAEHAGKFLVNLGGGLGLIGFALFLITLPFVF